MCTTIPEQSANALLIASAPALLEENQRMRKALSQIEDWTSVKSIPLVNDINRCAKDALKKADQIAAMIQGDGGANWYQSLLLGNVIKYDKARDLPDDETVRRIISESVNLWLACKARREATHGETEDGAKITITAEEWRQRGINEKAILDRIEGKI